MAIAAGPRAITIGRPMNAHEEAEANYFAMCLLMPEAFVRREVARFAAFDINNEKHVAQLAKTFQVSPGMMGYRLAQLSESH